MLSLPNSSLTIYPAQLDLPAKKATMSRRYLYLLILFLFFIAATIVVTWQYRTAVYQPLNPDTSDAVTFTILQGESGNTVAQRLYQENIIRSITAAQIYFRLQQRNNRYIQAGEYQLSATLSLAQIYDLFQHGTFDLTLTIPEGKRLEEIAQIVNTTLNIPTGAFLAAAQGKRGYLFPDTYIIPDDITSTELVQFMIDNFNKKVDSSVQQKFSQQGLTTDKAVIIASIVEREAKFDLDRPLIAGILVKRFRNDWLLEADATVQFAKANQVCQEALPCDWWSNNLTDADLNFNSPYNTRLIAGLPPTPICSPGLKSLAAVAESQESPYWYYLSDKQGKTHYSISYEEHLLKVARYLQ